jgi:peptide deformylase
MAAQGEVQHEEPDVDAQIAVRRRLALAQIRQYPDAALRLKAHAVERFDDGLAATQVGVLQRVFVFQAEEDDEPRVVVNPRIDVRSDEVEVADEGCLSLQGVLVPVERNLSVTLEGQDLAGEPLRLELAEMPARIVQHELDHLDGVLIVERTDAESRRDALATLRRNLS